MPRKTGFLIRIDDKEYRPSEYASVAFWMKNSNSADVRMEVYVTEKIQSSGLRRNGRKRQLGSTTEKRTRIAFSPTGTAEISS